MPKILKSSFFNRSAISVAQDLLGKFIVRRHQGKEIALMITEVEAYDGFEDKASHASRGCTERNKVMFGEPGYWYVYFTYGMHWMLNIVTGPKNYPAAVLIRVTNEVSGPARLTKFLHIDEKLNGKMSSRASGLWLEDRGVMASGKKITKAPRVGVAYAGEWADKPYRFILE